jgi:hypothetical protein
VAKQQQALAAEGASVADQAAAAEQMRASTCKHTVLFSFTCAGGEPVFFSGFYYTLAKCDYVFKVPKPQNERFFELLRGGRDCFFLSPPSASQTGHSEGSFFCRVVFGSEAVKVVVDLRGAKHPTGWLEQKNKSCAAEKARRAALPAGAAAGGGGGAAGGSGGGGAAGGGGGGGGGDAME